MLYSVELFEPKSVLLVWMCLILSFLCLWLSLSNISLNRLRNEKISVIHEMFIWFAVTSRHLALPFGLMASSLGTSLFFFNIYGSVD